MPFWLDAAPCPLLVVLESFCDVADEAGPIASTCTLGTTTRVLPMMPLPTCCLCWPVQFGCALTPPVSPATTVLNTATWDPARTLPATASGLQSVMVIAT